MWVFEYFLSSRCTIAAPWAAGWVIMMYVLRNDSIASLRASFDEKPNIIDVRRSPEWPRVTLGGLRGAGVSWPTLGLGLEMTTGSSWAMTLGWEVTAGSSWAAASSGSKCAVSPSFSVMMSPRSSCSMGPMSWILGGVNSQNSPRISTDMNMPPFATHSSWSLASVVASSLSALM